MPEDLLDGIEIEPAPQHERRCRMPEIVERVRHFEIVADATEGIAQDVRMETSADLVGENVITFFPIFTSLEFPFGSINARNLERFERHCIQWNFARFVRLGALDIHAFVALGERLGHADDASSPISIGSALPFLFRTRAVRSSYLSKRTEMDTLESVTVDSLGFLWEWTPGVVGNVILAIPRT